MELTNSLRKMIDALDERKHRRAEAAWKAEGTKCVCDLIGHFPLRVLIATDSWIDQHRDLLAAVDPQSVITAPMKSMARLSRLDSAPPVIALFELPSYTMPVLDNDSLVLALDAVQDPGNLGTIIRTADWMGVRDILCSAGTADAFAPKVVMATMGALARVRVHYCDLAATIGSSGVAAVYGTFLDGKNIYSTDLTPGGIVVMGNEGRGISSEIAALTTRRLFIPSYPPGQPTSESLNVATATAITLAEFRRRQLVK